MWWELFATLVYLHGAAHAAIVRLPDLRTEPRIAMMAEVLARHGDELADAIVTVRGRRIRFSRPTNRPWKLDRHNDRVDDLTDQGGTAMPIERMLTEEEPVADLVGRVLQEAGIEYVFGISGGHTGRIVGGLRKIQNSLRMVMVREESLAGVMAEVYGRLTRRPGVLIGQGPWVLGNGMIGTIEAFLSSSPMLLLTDFSDASGLQLHAPYQQATGDYGSWDARRAFSGVTKQVMQATDPGSAVQATQLAIKHAVSGQPGPVVVLFSQDSLAGTIGPEFGSGVVSHAPLPAADAPSRRCVPRDRRRRRPARGTQASDHRRQRRAHRAGL